MTKIDQISELKQKLQLDQTLPLRSGATQLVFGDGNLDADIYFLGEAPGYYEDQQGKPFVGAAGKLLDNLLETIGIKRSEVYISNIVRFRPPGNRDPLPEEIEAFAPFVDQEIDIINPKLIVTLGRFSMSKFLPGVKISQVHGQARWIDWKGQQKLIIPMYHPAAALRAGAIMEQLKSDFLKITRFLQTEKPFADDHESKDSNKETNPKQLELIPTNENQT